MPIDVRDIRHNGQADLRDARWVWNCPVCQRETVERTEVTKETIAADPRCCDCRRKQKGRKDDWRTA
jgi:hypothetical protein